MKRLGLEALLFLLLATAVALLANAARADGLDLGRDYFPADSAAGSAAGGVKSLAHELEAAGLTAITAEEIADYLPFLQGTPGNEDSDYFLLDARNEKAFKQGRLPGAILCDHYRQDEFLDATRIERLQRAALIVVYCNGGDCPDSVSLGRDLVYQHKISPEVVRVYVGGWAEWLLQGRAVETE
ncbi:MAG TPA: rhodanese-like domain-containing protein [Planctomycetota bacterium]